jgi:hypothetical protein
MQILRHAQFDVTLEVYASASSEATRGVLKRWGASLDAWLRRAAVLRSCTGRSGRQNSTEAREHGLLTWHFLVLGWRDEPTASSSRSNPGGHALIWAKPNRGSLFLTCANALSGSR